jgi:hypothetical protein
VLTGVRSEVVTPALLVARRASQRDSQLAARGLRAVKAPTFYTNSTPAKSAAVVSPRLAATPEPCRSHPSDLGSPLPFTAFRDDLGPDSPPPGTPGVQQERPASQHDQPSRLDANPRVTYSSTPNSVNAHCPTPVPRGPPPPPRRAPARRLAEAQARRAAVLFRTPQSSSIGLSPPRSHQHQQRSVQTPVAFAGFSVTSSSPLIHGMTRTPSHAGPLAADGLFGSTVASHTQPGLGAQAATFELSPVSPIGHVFARSVAGRPLGPSSGQDDSPLRFDSSVSMASHSDKPSPVNPLATPASAVFPFSSPATAGFGSTAPFPFAQASPKPWPSNTASPAPFDRAGAFEPAPPPAFGSPSCSSGA